MASVRAAMPWLWTIVVLAITGCAPSPEPVDVEDEFADAKTVVVEEGPVSAQVWLAPAEPEIGDRLRLKIEVVAAAGVDVVMPAFADALGRYAIVDFRPIERSDDAGSFHSQRYTLEAPFSGRHRVPRLRITFTDRRSGESSEYELLTDEIAFEVRSVLPTEGFTTELAPLRGELDVATRFFWLWVALAGGLVGAGAYWVYRQWSARRAIELVELAHERALRRLADLEAAGLPDATALDRWYVELSDIVRRYVEERFQLRAPELTTEEFLAVAETSVDLGSRQPLLKAFLERCDAVKFARYNPDNSESIDAIESARRFLEETAARREEREAA